MGQVPPSRPSSCYSQAKCDYCARYGALGSCEGCGAPNQPVQLARPEFVLQQARAGIMTPNERRRIIGVPVYPLRDQPLPRRVFDMVKR